MANSENNKAGFNLCSQPLKTPRRSKSPLLQPRSKDVDTGCRSPLQKSTKTTEDYNETVDKNYSTDPLNESTTTTWVENSESTNFRSIRQTPNLESQKSLFQEPHGSYQSNFNKQYRPGVGYSMARIGMPIPAPPYRARSGVSQIPQTREVFTSSQFGFPQPGRYIVRNPTPFHYGSPRYSSGRGFTPVGVIVDPSLSPRLPRRRPENFGERMHAETQTSFGSVPTPLTSSSSEHPHDSSHFSFDHTSPKHKHKASLSITTQPVSTQVKHSSPATPPQLTPTSPITPIVSGRKLSRKSSMFDLSDVFCLSCSPARLGFSSSIAAKYPYATDPQKDQDFIGFASLPEQVHRKTVKRGFDFTLMVVGESGLGKSTLVSSLFLTDLYKDKTVTPVHQKIEKTVSIEKKTIEIEEKGVKLRLTVVDTPGFGDALNCEENWKAVERYVDEQFNQYFQDESGLNRKNIQDHRVHCCLYFIPPYGHGLRQLDIEFLRRLQNKVNIVPVVAKADTLTPNEIRKLKARILSDIEEYKVKIYQFPECDEDEDEDFKQQDRALKASIPFAVIGSNCVIEVAGKKVRGRQYPWGIVEVENATHCDFVKLRTMLISTHMQDLKEVTQDVHYETFRARCISQMHVALKERNKLKRDSVTNLDQIGDADRLLQQKDEEIRKMQEMLNKMQQKLKESSKENTTSYPVTIENSQRDSVINV